MLISMTPNDEVKTIHASLNDGKLRKWEFEPYTENGKIELTDQDYATIQSIKGNTVKFNQLVKNGNFADTSNWGVEANVNFTVASNIGTFIPSTANNGIYQDFYFTTHKYYVRAKGKVSENNTRINFVFYRSNTGAFYHIFSTTGWEDIKGFVTPNQTQAYLYIFLEQKTGVAADLQNIQIFDLTVMGIDNLTTVEQVETWLSNNIGLLPYYDYTEGSLISFNGTGLKTENASQTESNTLSLPISTLFPTGMKDSSVTYEVVDELTNSEATTKVGSVDLGTLNWSYNSDAGHLRFYSEIINDSKKPSLSTILANIICSKYQTISESRVFGNTEIGICLTTTGRIMIYDPSYSSAEAFKQAMTDQNVKLYYELETPTSQEVSLDLTYPVYNNGTEQILPVNGSTPTTSSMKATIEYPDRTEDVNFLYKQTTFESAIPQFSLVCKNQELPMALEDGKLICECDSSITNESGFFDCKVKMQDLESVAYSQKIQLHVERGIND